MSAPGDPSAFRDVFCIPHEDKFIVYLPLGGVIMLANADFVNLLHRARLGDQSARAQLGLDKSLESDLLDAAPAGVAPCSRAPLAAFAPTSVSLFLTSRCTLRCTYCYASGGSGSTDMPWDMLTAVLDQILDHAVGAHSPVMSVHFHGGGDVSAAWPLLVRARDYLGTIAAKAGLAVSTSTGLNGMLDAEQRQWILRNIDTATVSLDGPPEIQNRQRPRPGGGASAGCVEDTLKTFDEAGYPYGLRCTVTEASVDRLEHVVEYICANFRMREIKVEPMNPRGRAVGTGERAPRAEAFVEHFRRARQVAKRAGRELVYSGARLGATTNVFCQAAGQSCGVTPEGWLTSCYEVLSPSDPLSEEFFYGKYDPNSRRLVVDEPRRQRQRKWSVDQKPYCERCFCKWHCAGDCPAKSGISGQRLFAGATDRCYIARELTKDLLLAALEGDAGQAPGATTGTTAETCS